MDAKLAAFVEKLQQRGKSGVYVGRLNPMHVGHGALTRILLEAFPTRHLIMIGSCAHPISIRHLFKFSDRCEFVRMVFPTARIAPLPDFEHDEDWFHALEQLMYVAGLDPKEAVFVGGCEEDVSFYHGQGFQVEIINRFDGTTKNVSGTEIRDSLIHGRSLDGLLDPLIIPVVTERFRVRWAEAVKR